MQRAQIVTLVIAALGFVVVALAAVLGWIVVPNIIDDKIIEVIHLTLPVEFKYFF